MSSSLKNNNHVIRLKHVNKCALVDYCGCVPETWTRSATLSSARRGFLANGMTHNVVKTCPVWKNMIKTMPRRVEEKEWEKLNNYENTKIMFEEHKLNNKISENTFDSLGFQVDHNAKGKEVDDLRRSDFMPYQRARAIRPNELRPIKSKLVQKCLEIQNRKKTKTEKRF